MDLLCAGGPGHRVFSGRAGRLHSGMEKELKIAGDSFFKRRTQKDRPRYLPGPTRTSGRHSRGHDASLPFLGVFVPFHRHCLTHYPPLSPSVLSWQSLSGLFPGHGGGRPHAPDWDPFGIHSSIRPAGSTA